MIEISDELYDAIIEFYNAHLKLWNEEDETGYNNEDFYEAKVRELIEIIDKELPDEED